MGAPPQRSPFLGISRDSWVASNALAFAVRDRYPVSPGHTLVVTHRLVATWFEATAEERAAVLALVDEVKALLDGETPRPDGYNVGFNAGEAAGQTVPHLHVHVIPRFRGDMPDPRGGVRHAIPWKGNYLRSSPSALATGALEDPFLRHLLPLFARATSISIVAAFVQESGLVLLRDPLFAALARGARIRILTGDYLEITQVAALERLLDWSSLKPWNESDAFGANLEARIVEVARLDGRSRREGRRHLDPTGEGCTPLLFVRERADDRPGVTMAFRFLGPVAPDGDSGERPITIEWRLLYPMPPDLLRLGRVAA